MNTILNNTLSAKELLDAHEAYIFDRELNPTPVHSVILCLEGPDGEVVDQCICYGYTSSDGRSIDIFSAAEFSTQQTGTHRVFVKFTWAPLGIPIEAKIYFDDKFEMLPEVKLVYTLEKLTVG